MMSGDTIDVQAVLLSELTSGRPANHDQKLQLRPAMMMVTSLHRKPETAAAMLEELSDRGC